MKQCPRCNKQYNPFRGEIRDGEMMCEICADPGSYIVPHNFRELIEQEIEKETGTTWRPKEGVKPVMEATPRRTEAISDADRRFNYHPPKDDEQILKYQTIREAARDFSGVIRELCPDAPETRLAQMHVDNSMFWANAAIARWSDQHDDAALAQWSEDNAGPIDGHQAEDISDETLSDNLFWETVF